MKDKLEIFLMASIISFTAWFSSKIYNFFTGKIKEIDSIEGLKKDITDLKEKIDKIYDKIYQ